MMRLYIIRCAALALALLININLALENRKFFHATGLLQDEMEDSTLGTVSADSAIMCAQHCSQKPQCNSFRLDTTRSCRLMTAHHKVTSEQGGLDFYVSSECLAHIQPGCIVDDATDRGNSFNLSSAYFASYHPITKIRLSYHPSGWFMKGIEVHHGDEVHSAGPLSEPMFECELMEGEFVQKWEYFIAPCGGYNIPVIGCATLHTTTKTCGPYPYDYVCGSESRVLEGHNLLYIAGRKGLCFDSLALGFESCWIVQIQQVEFKDA